MLDRMLLGTGGASITLIASTTGSINSGTSLVINKPTGTTQGDLMVAFMYSSGGGTFTQPSGWTEVVDSGICVSYLVAGASEGSSYTFTASKSGVYIGAIVTYRNAVYDAIGTITTSTSTPLSIPAVTLSANGSTVLAYVAASPTSSSWSTPTGFSSISAMTTPASSGLFGQDGVSSGSTGTVSTTRTGQGVNQTAVLVGIKPA